MSLLIDLYIFEQSVQREMCFRRSVSMTVRVFGLLLFWSFNILVFRSNEFEIIFLIFAFLEVVSNFEAFDFHYHLSYFRQFFYSFPIQIYFEVFLFSTSIQYIKNVCKIGVSTFTFVNFELR